MSRTLAYCNWLIGIVAAGIRVQPIREYCDSGANRWVFKATLYKSAGSKGFVGYGDADPSNVSPLVHGAEMRVAETRAVNRALRKAYGIGLCSVEELGFTASPTRAPRNRSIPPSNGNGSDNGQPRLRDKLCLLIRKYELDPTLVKRYAADFCGTETLRDASRDLVEAFISTAGEEAAKDRAALICKLNSYCQPEEVKSMKRHFPVCMRKQSRGDGSLEGCSWHGWTELTIAGIRKSLSSFSASRSSSRTISPHAKSRDECTAPRSHSGN